MRNHAPCGVGRGEKSLHGLLQEERAQNSSQVVTFGVCEARSNIRRVVGKGACGNNLHKHRSDTVEDRFVPCGGEEEGSKVGLGKRVDHPNPEGPEAEDLGVVGPAGGSGQFEEREGDKHEKVP